MTATGQTAIAQWHSGVTRAAEDGTRARRLPRSTRGELFASRSDIAVRRDVLPVNSHLSFRRNDIAIWRLIRIVSVFMPLRDYHCDTLARVDGQAVGTISRKFCGYFVRCILSLDETNKYVCFYLYNKHTSRQFVIAFDKIPFHSISKIGLFIFINKYVYNYTYSKWWRKRHEKTIKYLLF